MPIGIKNQRENFSNAIARKTLLKPCFARSYNKITNRL